QQFQEQGYVALPGFFSGRATAAIQAEVERLRREGFLRNVGTDGDGQSTSMRSTNRWQPRRMNVRKHKALSATGGVPRLSGSLRERDASAKSRSSAALRLAHDRNRYFSTFILSSHHRLRHLALPRPRDPLPILA